MLEQAPPVLFLLGDAVSNAHFSLPSAQCELCSQSYGGRWQGKVMHENTSTQKNDHVLWTQEHMFTL